MLLLCDETTKYPLKVIGAITISEESFIDFEHYVLAKRVAENVFGEIKWQKIGSQGKYYDFYLDIVKKIFTYPEVRFHSNSYSGNQYKASYALIRSVAWKIQNAKLNYNINILYDKSNSSEIAMLRDYLRTDRKIKLSIPICTEIKSESYATLNVADILAGCTSFVLNHLEDGDNSNCQTKKAFVECLVEEVNDGVPFGFHISKLWDLDSPNKFQNFSLPDSSR